MKGGIIWRYLKRKKILIGKRIKEIRLGKGMTTKEFGELLSATDSNVSSWEKGRTSPNPERLKVIAKIGNTTVEELLYGDVIRTYFNEHWENLIGNEDASKEYYDINQEEFEYVQSVKEKIYNNFYKLAFEYGINNNNDNNFYLFSLSIGLLLSEYHSSKIDSLSSRYTVIKTITKAVRQITQALSSAAKQATNENDKIFYYQMLQHTEWYAKNIEKTISNNEQNML